MEIPPMEPRDAATDSSSIPGVSCAGPCRVLPSQQPARSGARQSAGTMRHRRGQLLTALRAELSCWLTEAQLKHAHLALLRQEMAGVDSETIGFRKALEKQHLQMSLGCISRQVRAHVLSSSSPQRSPCRCTALTSYRNWGPGLVWHSGCPRSYPSAALLASSFPPCAKGVNNRAARIYREAFVFNQQPQPLTPLSA